jgi:uncharacterized protein (DUF362 family)
MTTREQVSLVRCASTLSDEAVVTQTLAAIQQLDDYGKGLRKARTIAVKINAGVHRLTLTDGKQTELTEPALVEGAIRAIREVTHAPILIGDATTDGDSTGLYAQLGYPERLARYPRVRLVDFSRSELVEVSMRHPQPMFRTYWLPRELAEADAFVSLSKMKAHTSLGYTLCIKNLFGWMPMAVYGAPRSYLHDRLIRLPRVLADMAQWMRPCLNVVDGIVAANKSEWGGSALRPGMILAGTNCVATDSVGARVMGFDPDEDYPNHPHFYRRNAIKLAAQQGLGPHKMADIDILGPAPEGWCEPFRVERYQGDTRRDDQLERGAACVAGYRQQQQKLAKTHRGQYLALFDGQVVQQAADMQGILTWEKSSGRDWQSAPQFVVRCLPVEEEVEQMDWYAKEARHARQLACAGPAS